MAENNNEKVPGMSLTGYALWWSDWVSSLVRLGCRHSDVAAIVHLSMSFCLMHKATRQKKVWERQSQEELSLPTMTIICRKTWSNSCGGTLTSNAASNFISASNSNPDKCHLYLVLGWQYGGLLTRWVPTAFLHAAGIIGDTCLTHFFFFYVSL